MGNLVRGNKNPCDWEVRGSNGLRAKTDEADLNPLAKDQGML